MIFNLKAHQKLIGTKTPELKPKRAEPVWIIFNNEPHKRYFVEWDKENPHACRVAKDAQLTERNYVECPTFYPSEGAALKALIDIAICAWRRAFEDCNKALDNYLTFCEKGMRK